MSDVVIFRHKHHWDILAGNIIARDKRESEERAELISKAHQAFDEMFEHPLQQLEKLGVRNEKI